MWPIVVIALLVVVVGSFVVYVARQPAEFAIQREADFDAPPDVVFAQVNDFHAWEAWSPWAKLDPSSVATFDGAPAGPGAKFGWSGNKKVGEGRMTIIDSKPNEFVKIKLEFIKPFTATNETLFTFTPRGTGTHVTWRMTGRNAGFFHRAICTLMNMDKMVGRDFEKGLASMKQIAEATAAS